MLDQRTVEGAEVRERIGRYLRRSRLAGLNARVVALTGDASDRNYFRVIPSDGPSIVLALHSGPIEFASLPFANVADLLQHVPLPVPAVLDHDDAIGIIALQDLGDVTLQAHLGADSPSEHAALYRQAVAFIDLLQRRGVELASDSYVPFRMAFDVEKLTWELEYFVRHFVVAFRGVVLRPAQQTALAEEWAAIVGELASEPRVLCHRDYHSRNLMLHDGNLYIIDFQDARLGPDTYDLASLLRDSYMDIEERDLEELIAYFIALKRDGRDHADFRRRFDTMALQRNLKALGTFGFQTTTRQNPVYLQYVPRTLRYARANLVKYPRFARLHELLSAVIDELR
jgi:aminoglycoside/choline kinase family phosphotransferase